MKTLRTTVGDEPRAAQRLSRPRGRSTALSWLKHGGDPDLAGRPLQLLGEAGFAAVRAPEFTRKALMSGT